MVDEKKPEAQAAEKPKGKKDDKKVEELSEEDQALKEQLDLYVERISDPNAGLVKNALEALRSEIKSSTSSMTSVPKPLKFLRPHYATLKEKFETLKLNVENKQYLADILSVLAMTMAAEDSRESLAFKLVASKDSLSAWGHEYVRNLAGEVGEEYAHRKAENKSVDDLMSLVNDMVPFFMRHNAEHEGCDLMIEVDRIKDIATFTEEANHSRVCLYLTACSQYLSEPEVSQALETAAEIYLRFEKYPDALRTALRLGKADMVSSIVNQSAKNPLAQKQLAFILGRQQTVVEGIENEDEELSNIMNNVALSENFLYLAKDLDVLEAKTPEDIYKTHLQSGRTVPGATDSARQNLASTFVNAFVNAGFGSDKLMLEDGSKWLYKNKEHGMMSAAASLGMLLLWDVDNGLTQIDKYLYSNDNYVKAGALMAVGVVNSGVRNDCDPALALLTEFINDDKAEGIVRIGAICGLGIAYAGSEREEVLQLLTPVVCDSGATTELAAIAAVALGLAYVGSCNGEATETILQALMERDMMEGALSDTYARFFALGLGLLFLGKEEAADATVEALKVLQGTFGEYAILTVETCAFAGTGNVLKVQRMLHVCTDVQANAQAGGTSNGDDKTEKKSDEKDSKASENDPLVTPNPSPDTNASKKDEKKAGEESKDDKKDDKKEERNEHQSLAVLGIALVSMWEELGSEMALRTFDHLLQYGDQPVRRAIPLALGLLCLSNPKVAATDVLSKLSHDSNPEVAQNAILGLGLVAAGSNNARVAASLRQLASFYAKEPHHLFMVRVAQGLVHMGKGLINLSPFHSDRSLWSPVAMGGILTVIHACLDVKNITLGKSHYLLYFLTCAMQPRMLFTLGEDLKPIQVPVRVGQAVDVVGQAGRPKTITGFQTHTTPVLLGHGDRAELATDEYEALNSLLEGCVILKKKPQED